MKTLEELTASPQVYTAARVPAPRVAREEIHTAAPALGWYTDNVLFGESWERPELPKRDRSVITVSALITCGHMAQMTGHLNRALDNGVSSTEIAEIITHLAFYAGWPCAMSAVGVMRQVFGARGIGFDQVKQSTSANLPLGSSKIEATDTIAPAFVEFTERVVQGDLWERQELTLRDRSLVTITSLIAQGQFEELRAQVVVGLKNGLTENEISETVTHLAFYLGWPKAKSALPEIRAGFLENKKK